MNEPEEASSMSMWDPLTVAFIFLSHLLQAKAAILGKENSCEDQGSKLGFGSWKIPVTSRNVIPKILFITQELIALDSKFGYSKS